MTSLPYNTRWDQSARAAEVAPGAFSAWVGGRGGGVRVAAVGESRRKDALCRVGDGVDDDIRSVADASAQNFWPEWGPDRGRLIERERHRACRKPDLPESGCCSNKCVV